MSGRIRQLKPDFHMDEEFWALMSAHPDMFLDRAFEGLWCHSDREGRFEWRPQMLKAKILPYWSGDFAVALELLANAGYVVSYEVDGRRYGWVRSFGKHQRPNSREPESSIPPPPFDSADVSARARAREDASPRASLPPLPIPNSQHPNPTRSSGVRPIPDVPGLTVVGAPPQPHPGPLPPSKRDQADAHSALGAGTLMHRYPSDFGPTRANQARGLELGLTEAEIWQRWDECRDKRYATPFDNPEAQFNRELAWAKADKEKRLFKSQRERDAFEMPGKERRA